MAELQSSLDHQPTPVIESSGKTAHAQRLAAPAVAKAWPASLSLRFEPAAGKTILRRSHHGPLMVQRPFYPEGETCHAYVLHPPGGIVGGDHLTVKTDCISGARGLVTTPGAAKFYGSDGRLAQQEQHISVGDSMLEWMPQESIFFNRCRAAQLTRITLSAESRFIGWDINCFGRPAGDHFFESGQISIRLEIYMQGTALLMERLKVTSAADLEMSSGMRNASVNATMVAISPGPCAVELLDKVRKTFTQQNSFAATLIDNLLLIRYLGHSAEQARYGFISAWRALRPTIIQRPVVVPRIWAT